MIKLIIKINSILIQRNLKIAEVIPKLLKVTLFVELSKLKTVKVMKSKQPSFWSHGNQNFAEGSQSSKIKSNNVSEYHHVSFKVTAKSLWKGQNPAPCPL